MQTLQGSLNSPAIPARSGQRVAGRARPNAPYHVHEERQEDGDHEEGQRPEVPPPRYTRTPGWRSTHRSRLRLQRLPSPFLSCSFWFPLPSLIGCPRPLQDDRSIGRPRRTSDAPTIYAGAWGHCCLSVLARAQGTRESLIYGHWPPEGLGPLGVVRPYSLGSPQSPGGSNHFPLQGPRASPNVPEGEGKGHGHHPVDPTHWNRWCNASGGVQYPFRQHGGPAQWGLEVCWRPDASISRGERVRERVRERDSRGGP